jgi:hypothetical protein
VLGPNAPHLFDGPLSINVHSSSSSSGMLITTLTILRLQQRPLAAGGSQRSRCAHIPPEQETDAISRGDAYM